MQGLSDIVSIVGPLSCCELASPANPCKQRLFIFENMQVYQQRACQPCLQLAQTFPNNRSLATHPRSELFSPYMHRHIYIYIERYMHIYMHISLSIYICVYIYMHKANHIRSLLKCSYTSGKTTSCVATQKKNAS
jgi:hypothetical protein